MTQRSHNTVQLFCLLAATMLIVGLAHIIWSTGITEAPVYKTVTLIGIVFFIKLSRKPLGCIYHASSEHAHHS